MSAEITQDDINELQLAIEEMLMSLNEKTLEQLASGLQIDEKFWKGKHKILMLRCIRKYVDELANADSNDFKEKKELEKILDAIDTVSDKKPPTKKKPKESLRVTSSNAEFGSDDEEDNTVFVPNLSVLKKDFIISGKIGDPTNEKDIGYLGIVRQMRVGEENDIRNPKLLLQF